MNVSSDQENYFLQLKRKVKLKQYIAMIFLNELKWCYKLSIFTNCRDDSYSEKEALSKGPVGHVEISPRKCLQFILINLTAQLLSYNG